jgi:hypothetical protein
LEEEEVPDVEIGLWEEEAPDVEIGLWEEEVPDVEIGLWEEEAPDDWSRWPIGLYKIIVSEDSDYFFSL